MADCWFHGQICGQRRNRKSRSLSPRKFRRDGEKVGELQAKLVQLDSLGERVAGLAGISPTELKQTADGRGGVLISTQALTVEQMQATLDALEAHTGQRVDLLTVIESRLFENKIKNDDPNSKPVLGGDVGSPFGWRRDPMNGGSALHTGLDFPASPGTPIHAAAGGVVVVQESHPAYGNMVEVDHGNDLITRYAHASNVLVKKATSSSGVKKLLR